MGVSVARRGALPAVAEVHRYGPVKTHIVLKSQADSAPASELDRKILEFIACSDTSDAQFEQLALELFAYQYRTNAPYRNLCDQQGRAPDTVRSWSQVPAISAASFAEARIACFPSERAALRFVSSGTTRAGGRASVHELESSALYEASLARHFERCVIPDRQRIVMVLLSPSFSEAPQSSLAYMLSSLFEQYASAGGFFIRDGQLDSQSVVRVLRSASEPLLVFGTALALVHFLDFCVASRATFALPAGSRLVETGGFKGHGRSVDRDDFYQTLSSTFGVPLEMCISEYGMCELGSQWYDASLSDALAGRPPRHALKIGPHWTRALVVDPVSAQPLPSGSVGLLQVFDLSNRGSIAAVLTGDLVSQEADGFIYVGRSQSVPPKGCSITVDSMLRSHA